VSAATATLYGALVAGVFALLGVAAGLVVEDRLRRKGEIRRKVRAWADGYTGGPGGNPEGRGFEVRFFNDRDVNIALWDPKVEFYEGRTLLEAPTPRRGFRDAPPVRPMIDLPSRTSVSESLYVEADGALLERYKRADRVKFVATVVPSGERLSEDLRTWDPWVAAPP
jgi:hypothetical protein